VIKYAYQLLKYYLKLFYLKHEDENEIGKRQGDLFTLYIDQVSKIY
jgi:hypothetical protein